MRFTGLLLISMVLGLAGCSFNHKLSGSGSDSALQAQAEKAGAAGGVGAAGDAALHLEPNQYAPIDPNHDQSGPEIKLGTSSETVERMARRQGCESRLGAALITASGPVEKYKVNCDNGNVFLARCELRQCIADTGQ